MEIKRNLNQTNPPHDKNPPSEVSISYGDKEKFEPNGSGIDPLIELVSISYGDKEKFER